MAHKGYAIHVGLDRVDDEFYAEEYNRVLIPLNCSANDAKSLAEITRAKGFGKVYVRIYDKATRKTFLELLRTMIGKLKSGDDFHYEVTCFVIQDGGTPMSMSV